MINIPDKSCTLVLSDIYFDLNFKLKQHRISLNTKLKVSSSIINFSKFRDKLCLSLSVSYYTIPSPKDPNKECFFENNEEKQQNAVEENAPIYTGFFFTC